MAIVKPRLSPPPINEDMIINGKGTIAFIRYLNDLREGIGRDYESLLALQEQIDALIVELDATQEGAGLNPDGTYKPFTTSNYINSAISLHNADFLLDSAIFDNTRELISTITATTSLTAISQTILCDATAGNLNVTLPNPAEYFSNSRSKEIAIHKIDTTTNKITILPNGTELVVGESSQELLQDGEILNFITDGINWHLGA